MSHVPHELPEMLGIEPAEISRHAAADAHFARQEARYRELNRAIHRAETDIEPTTDEHLAEMKRERLALLDAMRSTVAAG